MNRVKTLTIDSNIKKPVFDTLNQFLIQLLVEYRFLTVLHAFLLDGYLKSSEQPIEIGTLLLDWCNAYTLSYPSSSHLCLYRHLFDYFYPSEYSFNLGFSTLESEFSIYNSAIYQKRIPLQKISTMIREVVNTSKFNDLYAKTYQNYLMKITCRPKILYDNLSGNQMNSIWDAKNYSITNFYSALYSNKRQSNYTLYYTSEILEPLSLEPSSLEPRSLEPRSLDDQSKSYEYYTSHIFVLDYWPKLEHIGIQLSSSKLLQNRCQNSSNKLSLALFQQILLNHVDTDYKYFWAPAWPVMSHILLKYLGFAAFEFGPVIKARRFLIHDENDFEIDDSDSDSDSSDVNQPVSLIKYITKSGWINIDMEKYYQTGGKENWKNGRIVADFNDPTLENLIVDKSTPDFIPNQTVVEILKDVTQLDATNINFPYKVTYFKKNIFYTDTDTD